MLVLVIDSLFYGAIAVFLYRWFRSVPSNNNSPAIDDLISILMAIFWPLAVVLMLGIGISMLISNARSVWRA